MLILTTIKTVKATLSAKISPLTFSQARPTIEYSKQDIIALKHKHVNLNGLPTGTISTIRLKLNRRKIRKANLRKKSYKQEPIFVTYTKFKQ